MNLILVGVSGFSERWVNVLFKTKGMRPAALVDVNPAALQAVCAQHAFPAERCFTSLKAAMEKTPGGGVIVTIPTKFHYPVAREALKAGRHVLVEKPLTLTVRQSEELVRLARARKRVLSVVSQHRFAPYLQVIRRYCIGKELGRPLSFFIRIHMNRAPSYYDLAPRRTGHGVLAIQGVHAMDWIHWLFGPVEECSAAIGTRFHKTENEDNAYAMFRMKSGVMGLFDINHLTRGQDDVGFDVYFEKGVLRFRNFIDLVIEKGKTVMPVAYEKVNPQFDSLRAQLGNFVRACAGRARLAVTAEDGLRVMKLLESLYRSARKLTRVG